MFASASSIEDFIDMNRCVIFYFNLCEQTEIILNIYNIKISKIEINQFDRLVINLI